MSILNTVDRLCATGSLLPLLPATARAAIKAFREANANPDSLVRITFSRREEVLDTLGYLNTLCRLRGVLDENKTKTGLLLDRAAMIELTNGSGIECILTSEKSA